MNQLILAIILSVLPISELRGGLPLAVNYALKNNLPVFPIFLLIVLCNILIIFFIFFLLDYLNKWFLKLKVYEGFFNFWVKKTRRRAEKVEQNMKVLGFLALTLFVAIPVPITGAWTGCLIAWILGLRRKESILSISLGVVIAGIIILLASLGVLNFIY